MAGQRTNRTSYQLLAELSGVFRELASGKSDLAKQGVIVQLLRKGLVEAEYLVSLWDSMTGRAAHVTARVVGGFSDPEELRRAAAVAAEWFRPGQVVDRAIQCRIILKRLRRTELGDGLSKDFDSLRRALQSQSFIRKSGVKAQFRRVAVKYLLSEDMSVVSEPSIEASKTSHVSMPPAWQSKATSGGRLSQDHATVRNILEGLTDVEFYRQRAEEATTKANGLGFPAVGSGADFQLRQADKWESEAQRVQAELRAIPGEPDIRTACLASAAEFTAKALRQICAARATELDMTIDAFLNLDTSTAAPLLRPNANPRSSGARHRPGDHQAKEESDGGKETGNFSKVMGNASALTHEERQAHLPSDPIEDALCGQPLSIYIFLRGKKNWTSYDTLAANDDLWRRSRPDDTTVNRALRRLREALTALERGAGLVIDGAHRRTKLDK